MPSAPIRLMGAPAGQAPFVQARIRARRHGLMRGHTTRPIQVKFLGFRLDRKKRIGIALESVERFKTRVREIWDARRSRSSNQLREDWNRYVRGWWGYFRLAEARAPMRDLEGWVRRNI